MISPTYLKQVLSYCDETGVFIWKESPRPGWVGKVAGIKTSAGYIRVQLQGRKYMAHRLVWLYTFGREPDVELDHINGDRSDNRLSNLREATRAENMQNKKPYSNNKSGFIGVSWSPVRRKWTANIQSSRVQKNVGFFDTPQEAHQAYLAAKAERHAFQPVPRPPAMA